MDIHQRGCSSLKPGGRCASVNGVRVHDPLAPNVCGGSAETIAAKRNIVETDFSRYAYGTYAILTANEMACLVDAR